MLENGRPQPDVHNRLQHAEVLQSSAADLMSIQAPCIMALLVSSLMGLLAFGSLPTPWQPGTTSAGPNTPGAHWKLCLQ